MTSPDPTISFPASYDRATKLVSAVVCLGLLVLAIATGSLLVGCIALLLTGVAYGYSPRGYVISERSIIVKRPLKEARFALEDVRAVRPAVKDDYLGCIRL